MGISNPKPFLAGDPHNEDHRIWEFVLSVPCILANYHMSLVSVGGLGLSGLVLDDGRVRKGSG